jgi:plasmid stabilization system protein ParE
MKVRYSRLALAELVAILSDLAAVNPAAAQRFETRVSQITKRIGRFPNGFQETAERPGVRRVPLLRYPYLLFYKVIAGEAVILRIVHGARKEPWENL